jgi:hypothetical protein
MLDTASVSFAIGKLSEAWQKAAPTLQNMSEEYVKFIVAKAVLQLPIAIIITVVAIAAARFFQKKLDDWDEGAIIGTVFSYLAIAAGVVSVCVCSYDAALALWCPEMYTINQIIGAAQ